MKRQDIETAVLEIYRKESEVARELLFKALVNNLPTDALQQLVADSLLAARS